MCWNEISFSGSTDGLLRFWENEEGKSSHIFLLSWTSCLFIFVLWAFLCLDLLRCNFSNLSSVIWLASEDIISITKELSIHGPITSLCLGSNALFVHKIPISCFRIFKEHMYYNGCNLWLYYTCQALPANKHLMFHSCLLLHIANNTILIFSCSNFSFCFSIPVYLALTCCKCKDGIYLILNLRGFFSIAICLIFFIYYVCECLYLLILKVN